MASSHGRTAMRFVNADHASGEFYLASFLPASPGEVSEGQWLTISLQVAI